MLVNTTRFGSIDIREGDLLEFPLGMIGLEDCQRWVVLADATNSSLGWLQSIDRPDLAFAVVSPRRYVPGYRARVTARDLTPLDLPIGVQPQVLVTVSRHTNAQGQDELTLNLKAPVVVCLESGRGRQVVAKDDHSIRHRIGSAPVATMPLRRSA